MERIIHSFYFRYHELHPDQAHVDNPEFNICGYIPITDELGYIIERTDEQYGDYYFRRLTINNKTFEYEDQPRVLAFHVKCLTVCYDFQSATRELNVILRQETRKFSIFYVFKPYFSWNILVQVKCLSKFLHLQREYSRIFELWNSNLHFISLTRRIFSAPSVL